MPPVISIEGLRDQLDGDWVAVDRHGEIVEYSVPKDIGPATLSVSPVSDALKEVNDADNIVGSVDKNTVWSVDAIVLNSIVLSRLPDQTFTAEELIEAVREAGFVWQITPSLPTLERPVGENSGDTGDYRPRGRDRG